MCFPYPAGQIQDVFILISKQLGLAPVNRNASQFTEICFAECWSKCSSMEPILSLFSHCKMNLKELLEEKNGNYTAFKYTGSCTQVTCSLNVRKFGMKISAV